MQCPRGQCPHSNTGSGVAPCPGGSAHNSTGLKSGAEGQVRKTDTSSSVRLGLAQSHGQLQCVRWLFFAARRESRGSSPKNGHGHSSRDCKRIAEDQVRKTDTNRALSSVRTNTARSSLRKGTGSGPKTPCVNDDATLFFDESKVPVEAVAVSNDDAAGLVPADSEVIGEKLKGCSSLLTPYFGQLGFVTRRQRSGPKNGHKLIGSAWRITA